jgi:hypothetical protein
MTGQSSHTSPYSLVEAKRISDLRTRARRAKPSKRGGRQSLYMSSRSSNSRKASSLTACERERTPSLCLALST